MSATRFASVILDVDSTLSGIEGIDWLAERRGAVVAAEVARLTERAMDGAITLDEVYDLRLQLVQPSRADCEQLGVAYKEAMAPGADLAPFYKRGALLISNQSLIGGCLNWVA